MWKKKKRKEKKKKKNREEVNNVNIGQVYLLVPKELNGFRNLKKKKKSERSADDFINCIS